MTPLERLAATIETRKGADPETSWTAKLLAKGPEKCAEKFGEEAVEAVAAYLPHRPKPANPAGLMKNLRERNGRLHWHWDPNFLSGTQTDRASQPQRLADAVQRIAAPTLLVRGDHSEIVSHEDVEAFQALAPHAEAVVVKGASHMVAGDENTAFGEALLDFLERNAPPKL